MGSPPSEPDRRPGEDQVEVSLTKGYWMAKYEVAQGDWKRIIGKLPGEPTAELPDEDDLPVGNVNFAEAEGFCRTLTEKARASGDLPAGWEFRLPTEAQWEDACRAATMTATAFGNSLSSRQANFKGKPYNGAEPGPSLGRAAKVGSYPPNAWNLHDMHARAGCGSNQSGVTTTSAFASRLFGSRLQQTEDGFLRRTHWRGSRLHA
jgi:sulfatase modifying factor 1